MTRLAPTHAAETRARTAGTPGPTSPPPGRGAGATNRHGSWQGSAMVVTGAQGGSGSWHRAAAWGGCTGGTADGSRAVLGAIRAGLRALRGTPRMTAKTSTSRSVNTAWECLSTQPGCRPLPEGLPGRHQPWGWSGTRGWTGKGS